MPDHATVKSFLDQCKECDGLTYEQDIERTIQALAVKTPQHFSPRGAAVNNEELSRRAREMGIPNAMRLRQLLDMDRDDDDIINQILLVITAHPELRKSELYLN